MIADLHAGPVAANKPVPVRSAALLGQEAGEVEARLGGVLTGLGNSDFATHEDQAAGKGEV